MLLLLQAPLGFFPRPALLPVAAEAPALRLKHDLGIALASLPGHNLIPALSNFPKPGRSPIQSKTQGIKNSRLARTRRAGQSKNPIGNIFGISKIDPPLTIKGVEILKSEFQDLHSQPSTPRLHLLHGGN